MIQERIVIKDGDGNEKIITKHSENGITKQTEVEKKADQIISEKEMISDIDGKVVPKLKISFNVHY